MLLSRNQVRAIALGLTERFEAKLLADDSMYRVVDVVHAHAALLQRTS